MLWKVEKCSTLLGVVQHEGLASANGTACAGMSRPDPIKHGANEEQVTAN